MIIGISGYINSGKNTTALIINKLLGNTFEEKSFADKLKQIASLLTGIPKEKFSDQEFKKTFLPKEWNKIIEHYTGRKYASEKNPLQVREFLQKLGTEAIRDNIHPNAWVNALFSEYNPKVTYQGYIIDLADSGEESKPIGKPVDAEYPNWIITDCRFENEAQAIKDRGGIVIRVNRYGKVKRCSSINDSVEEKFNENDSRHRNLWEAEKLRFHPSETSLDNWEFDYIIENNGTIKELTEKVKKMLIHFNIISE